MLAVLLEFNVKPGLEDQFVECWSETTDIIYKKFGSLGSKLHKSNNGVYVAYAQWPSREIYESEQSWSQSDSAVREKMRSTLVGGKPTVLHQLSLVSDLTQSKSHKLGNLHNKSK